MAKHLMVDLETLAVSPHTVVLTLGAVKFDPFSDKIFEELYFRINVDQQTALGREVDPDTLNWWSQQNPEIMEEAFNPDNRLMIEEAAESFHKFAWGCDKFWSHGSMFDLVIIEDLFKEVQRATPWQYWQCRDTRTLFDLGDAAMPQADKHNALADAVRQAVGVQNIYKHLKETHINA